MAQWNDPEAPRRNDETAAHSAAKGLCGNNMPGKKKKKSPLSASLLCSRSQKVFVPPARPVINAEGATLWEDSGPG